MASRYLNDFPIEIIGYILRMAIRTPASYGHSSNHRRRAGQWQQRSRLASFCNVLKAINRQFKRLVHAPWAGYSSSHF